MHASTLPYFGHASHAVVLMPCVAFSRLAEKTRVLEQLYATTKELKQQYEASQQVPPFPSVFLKVSNFTTGKELCT